MAMKIIRDGLLIQLLWVVVLRQAAGQGNAFVRISGPTVTVIVSFAADGTLVWSNAMPGATYTIQMASTLPGVSNWADYNWISAGNNLNTNVIFAFNAPPGMAPILAGAFTIGDALDGETDAIPTNVTLSSFFMDINLVSYSQWMAVYGYASNRGYGFTHSGKGKAGNQPVETVDWYDCVKWSNARSQQAGLTPVYYTDEGFTQVYTNGDSGTTVYADWGADGYRLPTEAEWEKAARGGLSGRRFPWGDTISERQANYRGNTGSFSYDLGPSGFNAAFTNGVPPYTSPGGAFTANGYGLYDMAGNVFVWCWDWYAGPPYPPGSPYLGGIDPRGPVGPLSDRVWRGGCWNDFAYYAKCAYRLYFDPSYPSGDYAIGFRCVRGRMPETRNTGETAGSFIITGEK